MSDEVGGCVVVVLLVALTVFMVFGIFAIFANREINDELRSRGLTEYDKQTGNLIWTEKSGGEKGGDK